jgi:hypothetical protein
LKKSNPIKFPFYGKNMLGFPYTGKDELDFLRKDNGAAGKAVLPGAKEVLK